jgi:hypothetical protein
MNFQVARFKGKPNSVRQFEEAAQGLISAVQNKQPKGRPLHTLQIIGRHHLAGPARAQRGGEQPSS